MKKIFLSLIFILLSAILGSSCGEKKEEVRIFPGLIGAYYGNDDFTRIKDAEILTSLERNWTEETGHGDNWSGVWEGMLKVPENQEITFKLTATKWTELLLGHKSISAGESENQSAEITIPVLTDSGIPVKIRYRHAGGGEGNFRVTWEWQGKPAEIIPDESVYFTNEQALAWNWIPEPDPDKVDYSEFVRPQSEHVIVNYEPGRFCGWPANNGIWSWGDDF